MPPLHTDVCTPSGGAGRWRGPGLFAGPPLPARSPGAGRRGTRVRWFDQRDGLPAGEIVRLAQDERGFIWIGTFAGLVRYDGQQMRTWAPERLSGHVSVLEAGPDGDVIVRIDPGRVDDAEASSLYRIVPAGIELVAGPDGLPLRDVVAAAFGADGQFCVSRASDVRCRLPSGRGVSPRFRVRDGDDARSAVFIREFGGRHGVFRGQNGPGEIPRLGARPNSPLRLCSGALDDFEG